ncbi:MAG TPA: 30S ribosome-binding factor RbfA [Phycisphaerae bacterium]|nr:30S ribosome-binding factor RbfA [Phycisphaerae bacterium]
MAYRKERVSHFVRDVVSEAIANRISDPRVSRFASVTRVEISPDMKVAHVYVSVMGETGDARTTMMGLQSARGMIQTRLAKQINMRQCPAIRFHLDEGIKKALDTFRLMSSGNEAVAGDDVHSEGDPDAHDAAAGPMAGQTELIGRDTIQPETEDEA